MQMSYQLSDLKLSSCDPGALINQSDAQVLWSYVVPEPRVVTAGTAPRCEWTSSARLRIGVPLSYSHCGVFKGSCVFGSTVLKAREKTGCSGYPRSQQQGELF